MKKTKRITRHLVLICLTALFTAALALGVTACTSGTEQTVTENKRLEVSTTYVNSSIDRATVFHDQGGQYMTNVEPTDEETTTVRLRVRRGNATKVTLEFSVDKAGMIANMTYHAIPMKFETADVNLNYDYWICVIPAQPAEYRYHFVVENNKQKVYYNRAGAELAGEDGSNPHISALQDFQVQVNFATPKWSQGATWYAVMPDSFINGDVLNDKYAGVIEQDPWGAQHEDGLDYFGGDLQGIIDSVDYLQEMNVTALFFNPIWLANHNAGYGAMDLSNIDSAFGNEKLFVKLCEVMHAHNIKVMLDGVFEFCVDNNVYSGMAQTDPEYYYIFFRKEDGTIVRDFFGNQINFSDQKAQDIIYVTKSSIMQYYLGLGADGWRLDSAVLFSASEMTATEIIQDMRRNLKLNYPDSLLILENVSTSEQFSNYAADSYWNTPYRDSSVNFAQMGVTYSNVKLYQEALYSAVLSMPRSTALTSYNQITSHDTKRIMDLAGGNVAKINAMYTEMMTFVGSPAIHYGDEIGLVSNNLSFFKTMSWDRSEWNTDIFNHVKALSQLRHDYKDLVTYGTFKNLGTDRETLLMMHERDYYDQSMLVLANPKGEFVHGFELDVKSMEVPEGDYLYDYLSGNKYAVKGGKVTIDVNPYGAVLVKDANNSFAGRFAVSKLADGGTDTAVSVAGNAYTLQGSGTAENTLYMHDMAYSNFTTVFTAQNTTSFAAMARDDLSQDAPYYAATFTGGNATVTVSYRAFKGQAVQTATFARNANGSDYALCRNGGMLFIAEKASDGTYVKIDGSEFAVDLSNYTRVGFAPIKGENVIKDVRTSYEEQLYSQFDGATDSMFTTFGTGSWKNENGKMELSASENGVLRLAQAHYADFTVKGKLDTAPASGFAGITVAQNENSYVVLGRAVLGGEVKIAVLRVIGGKPVAVATADDREGSLILQIEKQGANYNFKYKTSEDGLFTTVYTMYPTNFSDIRVGLVNCDTRAAQFDYFTFGDALHDGNSTAVHETYGTLDLSYDKTSAVTVYYVTSTQFGDGRWEYVHGGYAQTDLTADYTSMTTNQGAFDAFRATYAVTLDKCANAESYVRFAIGYAGSAQNPVYITIDRAGKLTAADGTQTYFTYDIPDFKVGTMYGFTVVMTPEKQISVYLDNDLVGYFTAPFTSDVKLGFEGHKCKYTVTSYMFQYYALDWHAGYRGNVVVRGSTIRVSAPSSGEGTAGSFTSAGVTDAVIAFQLKADRSDIIGDCEAGIIVGGNAAMTRNLGGLFIGIDLKADKIIIKENGNVVAQANTVSGVGDADLYYTVVIQNKVIRVFTDVYAVGGENGLSAYSTTPVLTYTDTVRRGGAVMFYADSCTATFKHTTVYGLQPGEDYTQSTAFTHRVVLPNAVMQEGDAFANYGSNTIELDFNDVSAIKYLNQYSGNWEIANGELVGYGEGDWTTGCTISLGTFEYYELTYKLSAKVTGAWAGVHVNKTYYNLTPDETGHLFYTNMSGNGAWLNTYRDRYVATGIWDNEERYATFTIRCYVKDGKHVFETCSPTGEVQSTVIIDDTSRQLYSGYISLVAGNCKASFKSVTVKKLNSDGTYAE